MGLRVRVREGLQFVVIVVITVRTLGKVEGISGAPGPTVDGVVDPPGYIVVGRDVVLLLLLLKNCDVAEVRETPADSHSNLVSGMELFHTNNTIILQLSQLYTILLCHTQCGCAYYELWEMFVSIMNCFIYCYWSGSYTHPVCLVYMA